MTISFDSTGDMCIAEFDYDFNGIPEDTFTCSGINSSGLSLGDGFGIGYYNNYGTFDNWSANEGGDTLVASTDIIPAVTGGHVDFLLQPGISFASMKYLMLGSVSGTAGMTLPGGGSLPLTWDLFTSLCIDLIGTPICVDFLGSLNSSGAAKARFDTVGPVPAIAVGLKMYFAYAVTAKPWLASNFVEVTIQ